MGTPLAPIDGSLNLRKNEESRNEESIMNIQAKLAPASLILALAAFFLIASPSRSAAQDSKPSDSKPAEAKTTDAKTVPVIDGAIGTCSVSFTVTDSAAAPVYDAKIHVRVAYGFMYLRKMDLEVGTNVDGKARFEGLPARTKDGLNFDATKTDTQGTAFVDPATTCKSDLTITLHKK